MLCGFVAGGLECCMGSPGREHVDVVLRGERLDVRYLRPGDEAELHAIAGREEVARTSTDIPHPLADDYTKEWMKRQADRLEKGTCYAFAVVERSTGRVIGDTTMWVEQKDQRGTLGYIFDPGCWGKGYATEAARLTVGFAFERLGLKRVEAECFVWHPASARVLEKVGMRREGTLRQRTLKSGIWHDDFMYGMTRGMWDALGAGGAVGEGALVGDALAKPSVREGIETERMVLEVYAEEHAEEVAGLLNEPGISEYTRTVPYPYSLDDARAYLVRCEKMVEEGTGIVWVMREKASGDVGGKLMGSVGFYVDRENSNAELGYMLNSAYRGKGYATEAARAVLAYAFERIGLARVYASWYADNPASGKILKKIGMAEEGVLRGHSFRGGWQRDIVLCGMGRGEWDASEVNLQNER